jgi:hypothetical protein
VTLRPPLGAPPDWLESILDDVEHFRDAALSTPVARYAR